MVLLAGTAGKAGEHLGRVQPGLPALQSDDHPAGLGAVLLADPVDVDGEVGVLAGKGTHVVSPDSGDRHSVRPAKVGLELECKVKP